ncbi:phosphatidate cytidylyltransferase [Bifidobacterium sp. ESL0790]|uniref:phosphatidate cytidylyltransferase n=1 Tax=Bifidobacterium sp. ESL0790 TaxID=2983233 RepID=UPI0023FA15F9|nr:phosphatidate cytidylyltransferase [Bifidobacterium sp. ESL0790]WEV71747.1 phosphatidate cytidylyltransferase [Bifidobacterium sp. ESL0790]
MTQHNQGEALGEAETAIDDINKKTGRNMPQAVATAVLLIAIIVACLLVRIDLYILLIVVFLTLALIELRVDFATVGLHIPAVTLVLCCAGTLLGVYYAPNHVMAGAVGVAVSLVAVAIMGSLRHQVGDRLATAVEGKKTAAGVQSGAGDGAKSDKASQPETSIGNVAVSMFIVLYILVLASCIILPETFNGHPVAHAIMVIFLPALSDTGGLFAGAWLGKHKLSPRISPKKSVEGLIGSILFAMVGAFVIFAITYPGLWASRWWVPVVMGVMVGVVGTFGDLCASMLKRDMGIKDMGHLLKGHGGVMDRVDSILLCAPFFTLLLWATGM